MFLPPEKKVGQKVTNLPQKYTSWSVRWGYANVNLMKAIFGLARAVAEWVFIVFAMQNSRHLGKYVNYSGDFPSC
jgi:hypothetical protein